MSYPLKTKPGDKLHGYVVLSAEERVERLAKRMLGDHLSSSRIAVTARKAPAKPKRRTAVIETADV